MTVVAPPERPRPDELDALIREARTRQRKRWLCAVAGVAIVAGVAVAVGSIIAGGSSAGQSNGGPIPAAQTGNACGVRVADTRIVDAGGRALFREPGHWSPGYPRTHAVECSGPTVWVVWDNGAGMMQEAYVGARSLDRGRSWKVVFAERFFDVRAPHELDSYLGPWTLRGPKVAYFVGSCPACSVGRVSGTVSLWVTKDAGRTFRLYKVPALTGYAPVGLRVVGRTVTISAKRFMRGVEPPRKTAQVRVA